MSRRSTHLKVGVVLATIALLAAGCSDEAPSSTAAAPSAGPAASDSASGIAEAQSIVDQYRKPPTWQGPDQSVNIASVSGKKVTYISVSNSIPVLKYWSDKVTALLKQYGNVQLTVIDAKGSVDEANKGFDQAIAQKADAIVFLALPPSL
ncbi:MAG: hypothetical protein J2P15_16470, partial [Micromonosporaceae bacterium]|nr:hypothetical protein [Micromonosporaceae bacterium]